jgi:hypothetical protein
LGTLEELHTRYRDRVSFLIVYVKEAHPADGWVVAENVDAGISLLDPTTPGERAACAVRIETKIPTAIDALDNAVASAYGGWPDRLYLVGADGRIAYQGDDGPFGFHADELGDALARSCGP